MSKGEEIIDKYMLPVANRISNNLYLTVLRDAFMGALPLIIFGSLFVVLSNISFLENWLGESGYANYQAFLNSAPEATIFIMSLFVTFGIGYHLSKHYGVEELHGALIATAAFLIITPFQLEEEEITGVIPIASIGAEGMFAAIIVGFIASEIYRKTIQKNWVITMPQGVPEAVAKSFSTLIPATITLSFFMFINLIFSITPWGDIHNFIYSILQAPLLALGSGLTATLVAVFFTQIFWFFGLHGQILVNSVMEPIWQTLSLENLRAYQNNEPLPHIVNSGFIDTFTVGTGGTGMTLGVLILILIIGRSRQLKQLGKLATPAGIFNVNEPIIFGLPIVLNPLVVIPWILAPMVATTFSYLLMANGVVPPPTGVNVPWTTPMVISGVLATGSIAGGILQIVNLLIVMAIWWPFIRIMDKQYYEQENHDKQDENPLLDEKNEKTDKAL